MFIFREKRLVRSWNAGHCDQQEYCAKNDGEIDPSAAMRPGFVNFLFCKLH